MNAARIVANVLRVAVRHLLVQNHGDGWRLTSPYNLVAVS